MGQPVVHFEVVGKDAGKLRDFYGDLFGWKFNQVEGSLAKAEELGGARMMGPEKPVPDMDMEIALFTDPEGHTIGLVKMG